MTLLIFLKGLFKKVRRHLFVDKLFVFVIMKVSHDGLDDVSGIIGCLFLCPQKDVELVVLGLSQFVIGCGFGPSL